MPASTKYPRALRHALARDMDVYPVVAVMGARQVGKSYLCREIAEQRGLAWRTLDDSDVRRQALEDPAGLLHDLGGDGAFIDEVQRAPALMLAIKAAVDRDRRPGRYLLSGSNQPHVTDAVSDSLLGRVAYRRLRPLLLSELRLSEEHPGWSFLLEPDERKVLRELEERAELAGALDWRETVAMGGFPHVVTAPANARDRLLDDYVRTFASRDIREIIGVESSERFEAFLRLLATYTGQVLNLSGMAGDLGVGATTLRRWLDALRRSYLVEQIAPYSRNASQRVIKSPKLVMADSALALAASREAEPTGFHLETLVASDLAAWQDEAPGRALYFWRLASGQEVDFVLEEKRRLVPVEIKTAPSVGHNDARHLRTFRERYASAVRGLILSNDSAVRAVGPGIIAAPWWAVI